MSFTVCEVPAELNTATCWGADIYRQFSPLLAVWASLGANTVGAKSSPARVHFNAWLHGRDTQTVLFYDRKSL
jgi:hypothetical protein